jgi:hypothetical protein
VRVSLTAAGEEDPTPRGVPWLPAQSPGFEPIRESPSKSDNCQQESSNRPRKLYETGETFFMIVRLVGERVPQQRNRGLKGLARPREGRWHAQQKLANTYPAGHTRRPARPVIYQLRVAALTAW